MKRWRIIGFDHPEKEKSVIYLQGLTDERLIEAVKRGISRGCNLFSIRGFEEKGPLCEHMEKILESGLKEE